MLKIGSAFLFLIPLLCSVSHPKQQQKDDSTYTYKTASEGGTGKFYYGREIANIMNFSGSSWLERNSRQVEENSNLAVSKMPINENSVIADIGAGTGYYTFKIYNRITKGKIYAEEIQDDAVNYLKNKKDLIRSVLDSAIFTDQFFTVFTIVETDDTKQNRKILLDEGLIECIAARLIKTYPLLGSCRAIKHVYGKNDSTYFWSADSNYKYEFLNKVYTEIVVITHKC